MSENFSSSPPRTPIDEGNYALKAFLILFLLLMMFFVIASSTLGQVDLTPDTPPANTNQTSLNTEADVIVVQEAAAVNERTEEDQVIPVTGACTTPYTVRSGDSLSMIAERCGITVGDIRLANPQVTNINLIFTGQQLNLPGTASAQSEAAAVPVTGDKDSFVPIPTLSQAPASPVIVPVTGDLLSILAGTQLQITARNFPPSTPVLINLSIQGGSSSPITSGITGPDGSLTKAFILPRPETGDTRYVITVVTASTPLVQAASKPFMIAPAVE